jgi:hypothetical protein
MTSGPPPAPVETRNSAPPPRPGAMQFTQAPGNRPDINASRGAMFRESGVELNNQSSVNEPQMRSTRPEMSGPKNTDIDNILSGLKTKTVNIHENNNEDDSMVSISSLKDMQNTMMPKKTNRRKNKSDKNVVSLDI